MEWILASASELRPEAPPDLSATAVELAELREIVAANDANAAAVVAYWDAGVPTYRSSPRGTPNMPTTARAPWV